MKFHLEFSHDLREIDIEVPTVRLAEIVAREYCHEVAGRMKLTPEPQPLSIRRTDV